MEFKKMYERVLLVTPLEQRRFFDYYEASVNELTMMFDAKYVMKKDCKFEAPENIEYEDKTRVFFHEPIIDNILYMAGCGDIYKTEFIRKANQAVKEAWKEQYEEHKSEQPEELRGRIRKKRW